jgi:hypothetical protein
MPPLPDRAALVARYHARLLRTLPTIDDTLRRELAELLADDEIEQVRYPRQLDMVAQERAERLAENNYAHQKGAHGMDWLDDE